MISYNEIVRASVERKRSCRGDGILMEKEGWFPSEDEEGPGEYEMAFLK